MAPGQLSWHFWLDDFVRSETAARKGIDNTPPALVVANLTRLCEAILEPIIQRQTQFALIITSGYRCPGLNTLIGSKPTSAHIKGCAADIVSRAPDWVDTLRFAQDLSKLDLNFDQIIHEYGKWVHVSVPEVAGVLGRKQLLTIDKFGTRTGLFAPRTEAPKVP